MKKIGLFHFVLVFLSVFLVWYIAYPNYMWYLESNSFFAFIPDFADLQFSMPSDWAAYGGAYLLQFFSSRMGGALIQASFATIILLSCDSILFCLFRNKGLLWLSFIPFAWFISGQFEDATLVRSVWWLAISVVVALLIFGITFKRVKKQRGVKRFYSNVYFGYLLSILLLGGGLYSLTTKKEYRVLEESTRLDRMAERKNWDGLLQSISPEDARVDAAKQRWVLLALSEKGLLTERLFEYGVTDPACFFYEQKDNPFCRDFNSLFFAALGFHNEVIHHSFQSGIQASRGMNFRTMRTVTDAWLRMGNKQMAEKYLEILRHTSFHGKWVQSRMRVLESMPQGNDSVRVQNEQPFFIGAHPFLSDMARVVDRYPENKKAIDYLLCGLLISKDLNKFNFLIDRLYKANSTLPKSYKEAVLMLASQRPEILQRYPVSQQEVQEYQNFMGLLKERSNLLELKYGNTFWFYYFCTGNTQQS